MFTVSVHVCRVRFLIERALTSPRVAHHLYWLLHECLPADGGEPSVTEARYLRRLTVLQRALRSTCGKNMHSRFLSQEVLLRVSLQAHSGGGGGGGGDGDDAGDDGDAGGERELTNWMFCGPKWRRVRAQTKRAKIRNDFNC